ncbi:MAG TPA: penicillin-insensitive murein endopeptidase [Polyangiaceae bacterium]|jgi:penicillin-insensitive murein endopeptidase|nr:penicillin-insensitive murein endopeptidase [Polyangiaceae bacterium]
MTVAARVRTASRLAGALGLAASAFGCVGAPSPLAPGLGGSVGVPHHGVVTDAASLPNKGPGFERFRTDDVRWGSPRLVSLVKNAAAEVAKKRPGATLVVGDLGERFGGETLRHRSHRSGRDVDLLLYLETPTGKPMKSPGFLKVGADGLAAIPDKHAFARIDVDRTWLLAKALLTQADVDIQWIFVSRPVEAMLIEHARALGEDPEILYRAETVFAQPSDSTPHDDHFHVRIACTADEAVAGCEGGPRRPWQSGPEPLELSDRDLLEALLD